MWLAFLLLLLFLVWNVRFFCGRFFFLCDGSTTLGVRQARNKLKRKNSILERNTTQQPSHVFDSRRMENQEYVYHDLEKNWFCQNATHAEMLYRRQTSPNRQPFTKT